MINNNHNVFVYSQSDDYAKELGYEGKMYTETHLNPKNDPYFWSRRLEYTLGIPLEYLKNMNVLEIGCCAGRFTMELSKHAKKVTAIDLSEAIFYNYAKGKENVQLIKCDLFNIPKLKEPIDVVICRGVIQHTPKPRETIKKLFDYINTGSLVIFDVYKKQKFRAFKFKYFHRKIVPKLLSQEKFDSIIKKHTTTIYKLLQLSHKIGTIPLIGYFFKHTPFYFPEDYKKLYRNSTQKEKHTMFLSQLHDALYAHYDNPMTSQEVLNTLAEINQIPYSYDLTRNIFRCKKTDNLTVTDPQFTKHGVQGIQKEKI